MIREWLESLEYFNMPYSNYSSPDPYEVMFIADLLAINTFEVLLSEKGMWR
jgi:hypothetical protein